LNGQPARLSARSYSAQCLAPTANVVVHREHGFNPQTTQESTMNTDNSLLPHSRPKQPAESSVWTHALIWALLVVAALLLVGFTAVVNDITERGELRRVQQSASGSLLSSPDEMQTRGVDVARLLTMTGEKLAGR
jgi:hypothetical protein